MSNPARISQLRLTAFKSFRNATLDLRPVTFLTGLNSSGKSNALDALDVLSRIAEGLSLAEALGPTDPVRGSVRGGPQTCAPHGDNYFEIGCTVEAGGEEQHFAYDFDVRIEVNPELRIVHESLRGPGTSVKHQKVRPDATLYETVDPQPGAATIEAAVFSGKRGVDPRYHFRDTHPLLRQVEGRMNDKNAAERSITAGISTVTAALKSVFHLDPVPSHMRGYVPSRDSELKRNGQNVSAVLASLREEDEASFQEIEMMARDIAGSCVEGMSLIDSSIGDVMVALREQGSNRGEETLTPAREMSDGMLRFLAIAAALKSPPRRPDVDRNAASVHLVIEEIENGLHPSQAGKVLRLLEESHRQRGTSCLVTTHSPALLDRVEGEMTEGVMVCFRDSVTGMSTIRPVRELPDYVREIAQSSLGTSVSRGKLVDDTETASDYSSLVELFSTGTDGR